MNYTLEVSEKIKLLNRVLDEIDVCHLFENSDFSVDEMSMKSWLRINLTVSNHNKIPLSLTITEMGMEIRLDRISEALDWSDNDLRDNFLVVSSILKNIFTSYILVEYYGSSRTLISLFGQDGRCTNKFKYYEGLSFKAKREVRLYFPIY
ncbi:hypothetical protein LV84_01354 [Algoriphagus ratkowskyi]|uniref:Uncharacterized protein n=1 Tax=Algoriphagus ratkowskyi TaxID=57028 RepID=A0A2W7REI9_9BACT|nr:hypothetical protein [Algoriphagus ratkowskyi]PZX59323.1 hypothetical protein LV84_01354 [Algoriphagus ratkowskyi]TXD77410.1 hypothetical protein ESW18_11420 [Algoriphagus ratkowskyi]